MPANTTLNATLQAIVNGSAPIQLSATPLPTPIPAGMTTTALDWAPIPIAPFNLPLWVIFGFLSVGALLIVWFHWNDMSANLDAIKPWFIKIKELKLGKIQVLRLSRAGNFIPDCLDIFDNVISYGDSEENINQWHLNSPQGLIKIGGISAPIISEDWSENRDIAVELAINYATDLLAKNIDPFKSELNQRHKDLVAAGTYPPTAENPADLVKPINNGLDYIGKPHENKPADYKVSGRRLLEIIFPDGIRIPSFNQYNQNRFRKFWFKGSSSAMMGGVNLRRVDDEFTKKSDKEQGFFQKYGGLLIAAMIFLGCMVGGIAIPLG
jgi:hypothetical protein